MGSAKRTTFRMTDERARMFDRAKAIIAAGPADDPPTSDTIDAALQHLIESHENIQAARDQHQPETIQDIANTSVLRLRYRTSIDSTWRR